MPIVKLNALNIATLPARDGRRTDYRDALLPGLVLRVAPSGRRTWVVEYHEIHDARRLGRRHQLGRFPKLGLADAREAARQVLTGIDHGTYPNQPEELAASGSSLTVARLVELCLADIRLRPTTRTEWERLLRVEIAPTPIGSRPAAAIERGSVRAWAKGIRTRSGWTANRAFEVLSRAYSWGIGEELVTVSPCDRMPKPFEEHRSERVLAADELWALLRVLGRTRGAPWADAVRLLLLTGVRRAAVLGMRREELAGLEGPDPRWAIPGGQEGRSKSGRAHVVPLVPATLEIVRRRLAATKGQYLFPGTRVHFLTVETLDQPMEWSWRWRGWLRLRVQRALDARRRVDGLAPLPVPRWTLHGLRHAIATHLREDLGVAPDIVSLILGHAVQGPRVTRVYDRAERLGERRAALLAWAAWLEALGGTQAAPRVLPFRGTR